MQLSDHLKEKLTTELIFSTSKSSGPGGQNINKLSSKVELRFIVNMSQFLNEQQKQLLLRKLKNRINKAGELIITSQAERTQRQNKKIVISKFFEHLEKALKPTRKRIKTKAPKSEDIKRLELKKKHAQKKLLRRKPEQ